MAGASLSRARAELRGTMANASGQGVFTRAGCAAAILLALACLASADAAAGRVSPDLEARLAGKPKGERIPVIIELTTRADVSKAAAGKKGNRHARGKAVVDELRGVAARTQPPVLEALAAERAQGDAGDVKSFWVFNGLATRATEKAIRRIAARQDVRE